MPLLLNYSRTKRVVIREERAFLSEAPTVNTDPNAPGAAGFSASSGDNSVAGFDPVLISLIRRSMPNLMAYDLCGVQPMNGPTGLIFAMRSRKDGQTGDETFYNEVDSAFSAGNKQGSETQGNYSGQVGAGATVGFGTTGGQKGSNPSLYLLILPSLLNSKHTTSVRVCVPKTPKT